MRLQNLKTFDEATRLALEVDELMRPQKHQFQPG